MISKFPLDSKMLNLNVYSGVHSEAFLGQECSIPNPETAIPLDQGVLRSSSKVSFRFSSLCPSTESYVQKMRTDLWSRLTMASDGDEKGILQCYSWHQT